MERVRAESGEYPVTLPDNASVVDHLNAPNEPVSAEAAADEEAAASEKANWAWPNFDNSAIPAAFTLGAVETGIVLGLMNLLFLSFVIVQIPYLFGGMEMVQNTPDFKLSIYARRGFGELVAVSALVLPVLLGSHWLIRQKDRLAGVLFKSLASVQLILLFVIMASAVQRLVLLTGNLGYGMTNLRLYPLIFMLWLAIVFVWFSATVLRGARQYFAWGALWTAFIVLGATHFLNPDAFIVKTNIALMQQGREFDASFNSSLSDDALPYLYEALPQFNEEDQRVIAVRLARRYCRITEDSDWRSFNFAGSRASSILSASGPFAAEIDCEFLKNNWWRMRKVPPHGTVEPVSQPAEPLTVDGETNGRS
jgi:hypothetical protein